MWLLLGMLSSSCGVHPEGLLCCLLPCMMLLQHTTSTHITTVNHTHIRLPGWAWGVATTHLNDEW